MVRSKGSIDLKKILFLLFRIPGIFNLYYHAGYNNRMKLPLIYYFHLKFIITYNLQFVCVALILQYCFI